MTNGKISSQMSRWAKEDDRQDREDTEDFMSSVDKLPDDFTVKYKVEELRPVLRELRRLYEELGE